MLEARPLNSPTDAATCVILFPDFFFLYIFHIYVLKTARDVIRGGTMERVASDERGRRKERDDDDDPAVVIRVI